MCIYIYIYIRDKWRRRCMCKASGRFALIPDCVTCVYFNERNLGCNSPIRTNFAVELLYTGGGPPSPTPLPLWNHILPVWCSTARKFSGLCAVNRVTARLKDSKGKLGEILEEIPMPVCAVSKLRQTFCFISLQRRLLITQVRVYGWSLCIRIRGKLFNIERALRSSWET